MLAGLEVMMFAIEMLDESAREYFNHLPASVQEHIMQSGVMPHTRQELEQLSFQLRDKGKEQ